MKYKLRKDDGESAQMRTLAVFIVRCRKLNKNLILNSDTGANEFIGNINQLRKLYFMKVYFKSKVGCINDYIQFVLKNLNGYFGTPQTD